MPLSSGTFGAETAAIVQERIQQGMADLVEKHISFTKSNNHSIFLN